MQKIRLFPLLLLVCLLLSACAASSESSPSVPPADTAAPPTESAEPSPAPTAAPEETEPAEPDPQPEPTEAAAFTVEEPAAVPIAQGANGVFSLLEREDATVNLVVCRNAETGALEFHLWLYAQPEEDITYRYTSPVLNDSIVILESGQTWGDSPAQHWKLDTGPLFAQGILSMDDLRTFSCRVQKYGWKGNNRYIYWTEKCEVQIPEGFDPGFVFLPCLGASAEEQLLLDDGGLRVTLLGLGTPPWEDADIMGFLLQVENPSDQTLPFKISGLSVNGTFLEVYGSSYELAPGTACYCYEQTRYNSFSENNITDIHELDLLLLTDEEQNTGALGKNGGEWHSVELTGTSEDGARPEITEPLFENEWIRVGLVDFTEAQSYDGKMNYTWRLIVENISELDLDVSCYLDREDKVFSMFDDDKPYYFLSDGKIRSGGWRYIDLDLYVPEGMDRPDLPLRFMAHNLGGGRLLFLEQEPIWFPAED